MISCTACKQEGLTAWHFYLVKIKVTILKMVPSLCYCVVQNLNVFLIWRICSLSFISVKLLCFLRSWHTTAMLTLLLGFLSLVSIQWVYSALKLCGPRMLSAFILEFACDLFLLHLAAELILGAGVWVLYLPCPVRLLSVSLPLTGSPEALAGDKRRAHSSSGLKRKSHEDTNYVEISMHSFPKEAAFTSSFFWIISKHSLITSSSSFTISLSFVWRISKYTYEGFTLDIIVKTSDGNINIKVITSELTVGWTPTYIVLHTSTFLCFFHTFQKQLRVQDLAQG